LTKEDFHREQQNYERRSQSHKSQVTGRNLSARGS